MPGYIETGAMLKMPSGCDRKRERIKSDDAVKGHVFRCSMFDVRRANAKCRRFFRIVLSVQQGHRQFGGVCPMFIVFWALARSSCYRARGHCTLQFLQGEGSIHERNRNADGAYSSDSEVSPWDCRRCDATKALLFSGGKSVAPFAEKLQTQPQEEPTPCLVSSA